MKKEQEPKLYQNATKKMAKKRIIIESFIQELSKSEKCASSTLRNQTNKNNSGISTRINKHMSQEDLHNFKNRAYIPDSHSKQKILGQQLKQKKKEKQDQFQPFQKPFQKFEVARQIKYNQGLNPSQFNNQIYKKQIGCRDVTLSQIFSGIRSLKNLKQTSSTAYTDLFSKNKSQMKPIPSFVKKKIQIRKQDYKFEKQQNKMRESFKIIKKLGQGKFGKVFLVKQIHTNMVLAMKIIQKQKIVHNNLLNQFIRQLKIHSFLDHPNIIKLYGFFHDKNNFYVIMECGCDGQLYTLMNSLAVKQRNKKGQFGFSQTATSFIARNLINAISYMHQNNILHRDLKPQNIVMVNGFPKICDLGWAVNMKLKKNQDLKQLRGTFCGTPLYLSPQLLRGQKYDEKVDLWAVGVLVYEMLFNRSPFEVSTQSQLYRIITEQIKYPQKCQISEQVRTFIDLTLKKNPKERVEAKKLLESVFIKIYKDIDTCQQLCV